MEFYLGQNVIFMKTYGKMLFGVLLLLFIVTVRDDAKTAHRPSDQDAKLEGPCAGRDTLCRLKFSTTDYERVGKSPRCKFILQH